ncbi:DUF1758 domain-containing protein [Trichonephila clavipes]|nr:DUF1758 domain-containing protein [Trichonephila clavipes]
MFLVAVHNRTKETLIGLIQEWIKPGTTIYSDCWKSYATLGQVGYNHLTVNHSLNFVDPVTNCHTNTIERNRDYTGMWVRLGSTDLMAGKVMFLRSNQGGRFDGNESVADSFRSDLVNFKSSCTTILGAFYSFFVCQKKPPLSGSSPATREKANEVGNREAARFFNIDESNIRLWRRNKTNFKNCDRRKRADRRGKPHWPELEAEINKWILKERDDGKAVSTSRNANKDLESLGVKGESYSNLLTPILLKQIPSELVLEFNRSQKDEGFDLSTLLWFLHWEIRSRERASEINSHKLCHYSPPPQDRTKNKGSYFLGQRMKPPPNRVHFRPHSFPTPLEKIELRSRKCLYCNKGHELDTCRSFGAHEKREILRKKGCCFLCLSPGHRAMECVKRESCPICNGSHHFSICFRNRHDDDLSPKRDTDNVISTVIKTEVNSVLLQTCAALIDVKNEQEVVRLFLDNGSQRSFVLKSTSEKFNFQFLEKKTFPFAHLVVKKLKQKL